MEKIYSYANKHSLIYEWEIKDVTSFITFSTSSLVGPGIIESPKFSTGSRNNDQWRLKIKVREDTSVTKGYYEMNIYLYSVSECKPKAEYRVFILNKNKDKHDFWWSVVTHPYEKYVTGRLKDLDDFHFFEDYFDGGTLTIDGLLKRKDEFLPNDTLTISVDLTVYDDHVSLSNPKIPLKAKAKDQMIEDFKRLFITKEGSDILITIDDRKFPAHKFILMARSPALYAKVSHENIKNEVKPEIFQKILEFIYTCEIENLDDHAEELLKAAHLYELQGLKEFCEYSISDILTTENAIRILLLAERYNAKLLMDFSTNFIIANFTEIAKSEEFQALEEFNPSVYFRLLKRKYATYVKNN